MFGPPSSPPPGLTSGQQNDLKSALLPAFGHDSSKAPRSSTNIFGQAFAQQPDFVKPKPSIYRDEDPAPVHASTFLPTPLPTSEANMQTSSPPPSSPQLEPSHGVSESARAPLKARFAPSALQQMLVVRVPTCGQAVTIGRSSKSSSFALRPSNRLASRVHCRLSFDSEENLLKIECLGWNGLKVSVPQEPTPGGNRDEYEVARGQTLNVERIEGITMNIHGDKALIEFWNDEALSDLTEDEAWSQKESQGTYSEARPAKRFKVDSEENKENSAKDQSSYAKLPPSPHETPSIIPSEAPEPKAEVTTHQSPAAEREMPHSSEEASTASASSTNTPTSDSLRHSANEANDTGKVSDAVETDLGTPEPDSRATSVEPSTGGESNGGSRKSRRQYKPISDELKHELMNIAANHVAFSRQSAVPFSSVRKANSTLQSLPKHQVSEIMRAIPCIGVIEGGVEDTTGRRADDEYYYDIAKDDNDERRRAVQSTKGHRSLRNCRKTPKQYFYRPLHLD